MRDGRAGGKGEQAKRHTFMLETTRGGQSEGGGGVQMEVSVSGCKGTFKSSLLGGGGDKGGIGEGGTHIVTGEHSTHLVRLPCGIGEASGKVRLQLS